MSSVVRDGMSLGEGIDESLLESLVEVMTSMGVSYAEARFHSHRGVRALLRDGEILGVSQTRSAGVAFRAIAGGGLGFASTNRLNSRSLRDTAEIAVKAARSASRLVRTPVSMDSSRLGSVRYSVVERKPLEDIPGLDRVSRLAEEASSVSIPGVFSGVSLSLFYTDDIEEKLLVTSDGGIVESRIPRIYIVHNISVESNGESANRWMEHGGTGGFELLDSLGLAEKIESDLKSLDIALNRATRPPRGRLDVVLSPEVTGLIAHEAAGHPSEADRVLGREAAQAGLSYRIRMSPGERIGSEEVTVIDDPTIPGSYGFYLFDDEGVPARPRVLIDRGVLEEYLHNRETAALMGVSSNAAARAKDYWAEPIVRMANTFIAPGSYSLEELIEDIGEGVYIVKYQEWNIDDYRWGQRYVGLEAYAIRNGRIAEPVRNPVFEATTKELFSSVDAVGRDLTFYAGTCGKGEPAQGIPVWFGGPHLRLRGGRIW